MKILKFCCLSLLLCLLAGCSQTAETSRLDDSDLPWAHPTEWEKTMPVAPGILY